VRERRRHRKAPIAASELARRQVRRVRPPRDDALAAAARAWGAVAGDRAREATPIALSRQGALTLACEDAARSSELALEADDLLDALAARTGAPRITDLRFVVGAGLEAESPRERPPAPRPSEEHMRAARALAAEVADPVLADLVARGTAAALARADLPAYRDKRPDSGDPG